MYEVEKGIPIPPKATGPKSGGPKYPFAEMQPGDSFAVPAEAGKKLAHLQRKVMQNAMLASRKSGAKFTSRSVGDAVRVWRVA